MDLNKEGLFDESKRFFCTGGDQKNPGNTPPELDLPQNTFDLQIPIPANAVDQRPIASRFRWGEQGLSFDGPAQIGEVEDYYFGLNFLAGDYNRDGIVNQADYNVWRKQSGQNVAAYTGADGNGDGVVNQADFDVWASHFGQTLSGAGSGAAALTAGDSNSQNSSPSGAGVNVDQVAA